MVVESKSAPTLCYLHTNSVKPIAQRIGFVKNLQEYQKRGAFLDDSDKLHYEYP